LPSIIPIVAGMAPCFFIVDYIDNAHYLFCGNGIPCEIIVDYNATTGSFLLIAYFMCGAIDNIP
jgi:hypothetical protein